MKQRKGNSLREILERLYKRFNRREYVNPDPLEFVSDFNNLHDREVAGIVASSLAFGNVKQIIGSVDSVLSVMGQSPADFLDGSTPRRIESSFVGFKHRWITGRDMALMLLGLRRVMKKYGSLEKCFGAGVSESDKDVVPALTRFVDEIVGAGGDFRMSLLPSPCRKSACKRLNLFLRWMVRTDNVDPGGWKCVPASMLLVPLDTHIHRLSLLLGLTSRRQKGLETAREITNALREISPEDPVKYDFALTRLGIRRGEGTEQFLESLGVR
jgi:uncharacterized protein (TIGR02757 family)